MTEFLPDWHGNQQKPDSSIVTFTGRVVDPIHPSPGDFDIVDIAHALSNSCRFTGHVREFYSVAEHSVRVAQWLYHHGLVVALGGLLHDASEAYLSDLARPIKQFSSLGDHYRAIEDRLQKEICVAFDTTYPILSLVREADNTLLWAEIRDLMPPSEDPRLLQYTSKTLYRDKIIPWTPKEAKHRFMSEFRYLSLEV